MEPQAHLVNLPHANTVVSRLLHYLEYRSEPVPVEQTQVRASLAELGEILGPYSDDPSLEEGAAAAALAAVAARGLADEMIRAGYTGDRLGQCVRNLFECLGLPEEGSAISLQCGERPDSPLRP